MTPSKGGLPMVFLTGLFIFAVIAPVKPQQDNLKDIEAFLNKFGGCESMPQDLQGCFCDNICRTYGDCCSDYHSFSESQQRQARVSTKCVEVDVAGHPNKSLLMVAKCPTEWRDMRIKEKCEAGDKYKNRFISEPVVSRNSSALYRNMYCAHCNMVEEFDYYGVRVTCEQLNNQQCTLEYEMGIENNTSEDSRNISDDSYAKCNFSRPYDARQDDIYDGIDIVNSSKMYRFRLCDPHVIEACPEDWTGIHVRGKCETYTLFVRESDPKLRIYRNPYCQLCNDATARRQLRFSNDKVVNFKNKEQNILVVPQIDKVGLLVNKSTLEYLNCLLTNSNENRSDNLYSQSYENREDSRRNLYAIKIIGLFMFLAYYLTSIILQTLHLRAFARIPQQNRTLLDRNLASYCFASLMISLQPVLTILFLPLLLLKLLSFFAITLYILYFGYASLFWTLTMSFDVWRSMREASKCIRRETPREEWRRFIVYSLWNWSIPGLLLLMLSLMSEILPEDSSLNLSFLTASLIVFTLVLVLNSFFFAHSLYLISKSRIKPTFPGTPSNLIRLSNSEEASKTAQHCSPISVAEIRWHVRRILMLILPTGLVLILVILISITWPSDITFITLYATYLGHSFLYFVLFSRKKEKLTIVRGPR